MRGEGVGLKKMASARFLALPGVTGASGLDVSLQDLSLYVADAGQRSVEVLKMSGSRSRQGLTPAGQILKLNVSETAFPKGKLCKGMQDGVLLFVPQWDCR